MMERVTIFVPEHFSAKEFEPWLEHRVKIMVEAGWIYCGYDLIAVHFKRPYKPKEN